LPSVDASSSTKRTNSATSGIRSSVPVERRIASTRPPQPVRRIVQLKRHQQPPVRAEPLSEAPGLQIETSLSVASSAAAASSATDA
jgi:hypothetical protein